MENTSGNPFGEGARPDDSAAPASPVRPSSPILEPPPTFGESVRDLGRFLYNHNPFYVISSAFVFWGLRSSFDTTGRTFETNALMIGLAGYVLILAVAAWVIIRKGQVWDDARTILLLIVLMLLAISVSFDETLAKDSSVGMWYYLGGFAFSVAITELTLRVIRLRMPYLFRVPYYLILALFFLYPLAISPLIRDPGAPALKWALFGFSLVAALVALTLLPAIRRGPPYVRNNGSPWRWPLYPWSLFVVLVPAVCARAYYLCCSFHFVGGKATIFRPYFLVPFLLALCVLLLEIGVRSRLKKVIGTALLAPPVLLILCIGHFLPMEPSEDHGFHQLFSDTLCATPLYLAMVAVAVFYCYAGLRGALEAIWGVTAALVALAFVGPQTAGTHLNTLAEPIGWPLFLAAGFQFAIVWQRRSSFSWLLGACLAVGGLAAQLHGTVFTAWHGIIPIHLVVLAGMVIGAVFDDPLARLVRYLGAVVLMGASLMAIAFTPEMLGNPPPTLLAAYPLMVAGAAGAYTLLRAYREYLVPVIGSVLIWLAKVGWPGYQKLRDVVEGLDQIVVGLLFLLVALAISLAKAGVFRRPLNHEAEKDQETP